MHAKRFWKDFEIQKLGECYDVYVQNDTLLLADIFKNFVKAVLKSIKLTQLILFLHQD